MERYTPTQRADVILFRDSIYYLPHAKIGPVLQRYASYLKKDGVFIVRMFDGGVKYSAMVKVVERGFEVLEREVLGASGTLIMVFRPKR